MASNWVDGNWMEHQWEPDLDLGGFRCVKPALPPIISATTAQYRCPGGCGAFVGDSSLRRFVRNESTHGLLLASLDYLANMKKAAGDVAGQGTA